MNVGYYGFKFADVDFLQCFGNFGGSRKSVGRLVLEIYERPFTCFITHSTRVQAPKQDVFSTVANARPQPLGNFFFRRAEGFITAISVVASLQFGYPKGQFACSRTYDSAIRPQSCSVLISVKHSVMPTGVSRSA